MMNQTLSVVPQGLIEGGSVSLQADDAGVITFSGSVVAGIGWFSRTFADSGSLKIDPSLLLCKNLKAGQVFEFPGVEITIKSVAVFGGYADIKITEGTDALTGTAMLDLSHDDLMFKHILLSGTADGHDVTIELQG